MQYVENQPEQEFLDDCKDYMGRLMPICIMKSIEIKQRESKSSTAIYIDVIDYQRGHREQLQ